MDQGVPRHLPLRRRARDPAGPDPAPHRRPLRGPRDAARRGAGASCSAATRSRSTSTREATALRISMPQGLPQADPAQPRRGARYRDGVREARLRRRLHAVRVRARHRPRKSRWRCSTTQIARPARCPPPPDRRTHRMNEHAPAAPTCRRRRRRPFVDSMPRRPGRAVPLDPLDRTGVACVHANLILPDELAAPHRRRLRRRRRSRPTSAPPASWPRRCMSGAGIDAAPRTSRATPRWCDGTARAASPTR